MFNLLKVEFYKLKKFQFGYIAVLFMFVMGYLCGDNRIGNKIFDSTDNTARAFLFVSDTSLVFLISIVMALFIGRDFSNRTICNEIKMGYSRFHILFSRTIVVCVFAALLHTVYVISIILGFSVVRGFDCINTVDGGDKRSSPVLFYCKESVRSYCFVHSVHVYML